MLWCLLSIAVSAMGPDPFAEPAAFARVTAPGIVLAGLAVLVGRAWPAVAVALLLPLGPWDFSEGFATSDLTWFSPSAADVKILPLSATSPFVIWYAYLCGRRLPAIRPALALGAVVTCVGGGVVLAGGGTLALWVSMISALMGTYAVPYLLGLLRRRLLHQRRQARRSAEAQARLRERARIAREMHDSLGHDLALIAVRAAGLEMAPGLDPAQVKAVGELRRAAAEATERLRETIGVLREDTEAAPLRPTREDLPALVERARASGMTITLDVAGPVPDLAHAVVQEGLTNVAKYAPGAVVRVTVAPHRVAVTNGPPSHRRTTAVSDSSPSRPRSTAVGDDSPGRPGTAAVSGGLGLAGLRERARLAGGTLLAGPAAGGFELAVELSRTSFTRGRRVASAREVRRRSGEPTPSMAERSTGASGVGDVQPAQQSLEAEDRDGDRQAADHGHG